MSVDPALVEMARHMLEVFTPLLKPRSLADVERWRTAADQGDRGVLILQLTSGGLEARFAHSVGADEKERLRLTD